MKCKRNNEVKTKAEQCTSFIEAQTKVRSSVESSTKRTAGGMTTPTFAFHSGHLMIVGSRRRQTTEQTHPLSKPASQVFDFTKAPARSQQPEATGAV